MNARFGLAFGVALIVHTVACSQSSTTVNNGYSNGGAAGGQSSVGGAVHTGGRSSVSNAGAGFSSTGGSSSTGAPIVASACTSVPSFCGGNLTGTWRITAVCLEGDLAAYYDSVIVSQYSSACANTYRSATLSTSGTISYLNGTMTSNATIKISEDIVMTPACFQAIAGRVVTVDAALCTNYETSLEAQSAGSTAICSFDGVNCNCAFEITSAGTSDTYTASGSTMTWSGGGISNYCVSGTTMIESDPVGGDVYVDLTMAKQ